LEEEELLYNIRSGSESAFTYLVNLYRDMVYSLCVNMLGDHTIAKDVSQEIFIKIFKAINRFEGNSSLRTWIYGISYNKCLDELKKRKRFTKFKELFSYKVTSQSYQKHTFENTIVVNAMESLRPEDKALLTFYYLEEMNLEEISEIVAISENTLKTRLFRARKKLRAILEKQYPNELKDMIYG